MKPNAKQVAALAKLAEEKGGLSIKPVEGTDRIEATVAKTGKRFIVMTTGTVRDA